MTTDDISSDLTVLLGPSDLRSGLERDARDGLTAAPRRLPPKYFYDDRGSELFEEITRLPEYYPTRAERALLHRHATEMADRAGAESLVELGSGSSEKTGLLLDAMAAAGTLVSYVPVDVSAGALRGAAVDLLSSRRELPVHAVVADFEQHLGDLPRHGRRLIAFLGGTLGNFEPASRQRFLGEIGGALEPGESLLLGVDLVKDPARLVAAYDDSAGVTAEFNRNVLRVLNRELQGDFDVESFRHVAVWDADHEWMEMRLRAARPMKVRLEALDLVLDLAEDEEIRTEISAKFRRAGIEAELRAVGLTPTGWWSDGDYALVLARR